MRCFTHVPKALDRLSLSGGALIGRPDSTVKSIDRRRFLTVTLAFAGAAAIGSRLGAATRRGSASAPSFHQLRRHQRLGGRAQVVIVGPRRRRRDRVPAGGV